MFSFHPDIEAATTDQSFPWSSTIWESAFTPSLLPGTQSMTVRFLPFSLRSRSPQREVCLVTNSSTAMSTADKKLLNLLYKSLRRISHLCLLLHCPLNMHGKITDLDRVQLFPKAFAQALADILCDPVRFRIFFLLYIHSYPASVSPLWRHGLPYI